MITKFNTFEGIRWWKDGKLGEEEPIDPQDYCDHNFKISIINMLNRDTFQPIKVYFKICDKCGYKERIEK